jgi:MinD superfamily P-loop ATPase containing an inserted ferredoxin domain
LAIKRELQVNPNWCKGCGICVEFCSKHVLEMIDDKVHVKSKDDCVYCGQCEQRCPDYAIYISEEQEEEKGQWVEQF